MQLSDKVVVVRMNRKEAKRYIRLKGTGQKVGHELGETKSVTKDNHQEMFKLWDGLKDLRGELSKAYQYWRDNGVVWGDGERITLSSAALEDMRKYAEYRQNIENLKKKLRNEYANEVSKDKVIRGSAADDADYQGEDAFFDSFELNVSVYPIQNPDDIRNLKGYSQDELDEFIGNYKKGIEDRIESGVKDLIERVVKDVEHVHDVLTTKDRFKVNSFDNVQETIKQCRRLNVTDNEELNKYLDEVESSLLSYDPDMMRKIPEKKNECAAKAKELADKMKAFF